MMKRIATIVLLLLVVSGTTSWAGGEEVFIAKCGSCHKTGGRASPVNPSDKAAVVWKKYFKRRRHPVDLSDISPEDMNIIITYLCEHAADSDQPAAAIIPK